MKNQFESEVTQSKQMQEQYLNALARRLWLLPVSQRNEVRREIGSHIELLVAEGQFDGLSELEATNAALQQMGKPSRFARQLLWQRHKDYRKKDPKFSQVMAGIAIVAVQMCLLMFATISSCLSSSGLALLRTSSEGSTVLTPLGLNLAVTIPALIIYVVVLVRRVAYVRRQLLFSTK